eukprot:768351-Hanusia_phi.AAC.2
MIYHLYYQIRARHWQVIRGTRDGRDRRAENPVRVTVHRHCERLNGLSEKPCQETQTLDGPIRSPGPQPGALRHS